MANEIRSLGRIDSQTSRITIFENINIEVEPALVRIYSNSALWKYLEGKNKRKMVALVAEIKLKYFKRYKRPLQIKDSSLLIEILAHTYCHWIGLKINSVLNHGFLRIFLTKLIDRAKVADCGEKIRDNNRWFWDLIAPLNKLMVALFPRNLI